MSMTIKLEDRGLVDKADIPDSCQQILVIYARERGFAFALEQAFQDFLRAQDEDTAAQMSVAILECLRRSLNTARGVA